MANTKITTNVIADDAVTSDKLGGDLTMPGHVSLADNKELRVGTGNDLVIKHDGSHTTLTNTTGNFTLLGDAVYIGNAANNEYLAQFIANGAASLRYDNVEQLATISGGVYVPNKLGVGTNSLTRELTVKLNGQADISIVAATNQYAQLLFGDTDADNKGIVAYNNTTDILEFWTSGSSRMAITAAGNVGIGTSAPSTTYDKQLHINASGTGASLKLTDSGSGTGASDGAEVIMYNTNMYVTNREAANMFLQTSANTRMTIDSAGKVGIGAAPSYQLDVRTASGNWGVVHSDGTRKIATYIDTSGNDGLYTINSMPLALGVGGAAKFWIDTTGKIGIGTASPAYTLEVKKSVDSDWLSRIYNTSGTDGSGLLVRSDTSAAQDTIVLAAYADGAYRFRVGSGGTMTVATQPVAIYHHTAASEVGAYGYSWPGTGAQNVICKPQGVTLNRGSMYNASNGRFTAPIAGVYRYALHGNLYTNNLNSSAYYFVQVLKNAGHYIYFYEANSINNANGWVLINASGLISMAKDDYIQWRLQTNNLTTSGNNGFGFDLSQYTHYEFQLLY